MTPTSNVSSTRRTVRALRAAERLTDANAGLVTLALTTAAALDDARSGSAKAYEIAQLARCHLSALEALERSPEPMVPNGLDRLLADLATPGFGDSNWT
jgi:hypothetical protein